MKARVGFEYFKKNNALDDIPCDNLCKENNCNEWLSKWLKSPNFDDDDRKLECGALPRHKAKVNDKSITKNDFKYGMPIDCRGCKRRDDNEICPYLCKQDEMNCKKHISIWDSCGTSEDHYKTKERDDYTLPASRIIREKNSGKYVFSLWGEPVNCTKCNFTEVEKSYFNDNDKICTQFDSTSSISGQAKSSKTKFTEIKENCKNDSSCTGIIENESDNKFYECTNEETSDEVRINLENISSGKNVSQNTTSGSNRATNAIDGNKKGKTINGGTFAITNSSTGTNHWMIDLGEDKIVNSIKIWIRTDSNITSLSGCSVLADDEIVFVEDNNWNLTQYQSNPPNELGFTVNIKRSCRKIKIKNNKPLHLAQVEVFQEKTGNYMKFSKNDYKRKILSIKNRCPIYESDKQCSMFSTNSDELLDNDYKRTSNILKRPNGFIEVKLDKYPYVDFIRLWKSNLIKIKNSDLQFNGLVLEDDILKKKLVQMDGMLKLDHKYHLKYIITIN